jgi:hypothetical protein
MSVGSELTRIINAKAAIRASIIAKGVAVPEATTLDGYAALIDLIDGSPPLVAPDAFTVGQWNVAATGATGAISINILALPADNGSAITALQYRIGTGAAVALTGTGTGARTITGLTDDVAVDVQVRAVNGGGEGAWSDIKAVTPTVSSGTPGELTFGSNTTDDAALQAGFFNQFGSFFVLPTDNLDVATDSSRLVAEWAVSLFSPALAGNLPAGAVITSVTIEGVVEFIWQGPTLEVRQALRPVVVANGLPSTTNYAAGLAWAGPSGSGAGDRSAVLSSIPAPSSGAVVIPSSTALVAAVQAWADGSRADPLWLYLSCSSAGGGSDLRLRGNSAAIADGQRPIVRVAYTA